MVHLNNELNKLNLPQLLKLVWNRLLTLKNSRIKRTLYIIIERPQRYQVD